MKKYSDEEKEMWVEDWIGFYLKNMIHSIIVLFLGQQLHNAIILKLHKLKNNHNK
jgi:hypothetical protein